MRHLLAKEKREYERRERNESRSSQRPSQALGKLIVSDRNGSSGVDRAANLAIYRPK